MKVITGCYPSPAREHRPDISIIQKVYSGKEKKKHFVYEAYVVAYGFQRYAHFFFTDSTGINRYISGTFYKQIFLFISTADWEIRPLPVWTVYC